MNEERLGTVIGLIIGLLIGVVGAFWLVRIGWLLMSLVFMQGGGMSSANTEEPEQVVLVYLKLSDEAFGSPEDRQAAYSLEDQLIAAMETSDKGECDGHEFGGGFATFFLYGPDADAVFSIVQPILKQFTAPPGSYIIKRYGALGAQEKRIEWQ